MGKFLIKGGYPLKGQVSLLGAKNASFKLLIASLLTEKECRLGNVPNIGDVQTVVAIIKALGGRVTQEGEHAYVLNNQNLSSFKIPSNLGQKSRCSSMFIGPLLARFGQVTWPIPGGGDKIGHRPIDRHLEGLNSLGVKIDSRGHLYCANAKKLKGAFYRFPKNTHTGTETLIMTAVLAKGTTVLENAACEPEVDNLIAFLKKMGAKIKRIKPRTIKIEGVQSLGGARHQVIFDRNEAVTFACVALATKGKIFVKNAESQHLTAFLEKLKEVGAGTELESSGIHFFYPKPLKPANVVTGPHPGFMTDWQPLWTVLMTQAEGESVVHETIFENRFDYVPYLQKMGAKIKFFNPEIKNPQALYNFNPEDDRPQYFHALRVFGPTPLKATKIKIPDIRAGATLTLAALAAQGETVLTNIEHLDRGYENLDERLKLLGAKIKRIKDKI